MVSEQFLLWSILLYWHQRDFWTNKWHHSQIQTLIVRALIIGWLLPQNSMSKSSMARSTLFYGKFRWCSLFHQTVWIWLFFRIHGVSWWNLVWGGASWVCVLNSLFNPNGACFYLKKFGDLWKLFYFHIFGWSCFFLFS